ncbi:hypothetical protein LZ31DRAFT_188535 [Colletotrichum somersetense]|nr:hypothetical protein LZ31DRAFT_188535 [Colletotrichum somersetense]
MSVEEHLGRNRDTTGRILGFPTKYCSLGVRRTATKATPANACPIHPYVQSIQAGELGLRWTGVDRHLRRASDAGSWVRRDVVHLTDISFMYACFFLFFFFLLLRLLARGGSLHGNCPLDLANAPRYGGRSLTFYSETHTKAGIGGRTDKTGSKGSGRRDGHENTGGTWSTCVASWKGESRRSRQLIAG